MALPSKPCIWLLAFLAMATLLLISIMRDNSDWTTLAAYKHDLEQPCGLNSSTALKLGLKHPISYGRLQIDVSESKQHDQPDTELGVAMPILYQLDPPNSTYVGAEARHCTNRTAIKVPKAAKPSLDLLNIVFGVATTLDRLEESLDAFAHWTAHTGTTIYCLVSDDGSIGQATRVMRDAEELGINLDITKQNLSEDATDGDRYFALTKHVYERQQDKPHPQWAAFIDDDTFFPSVEHLNRTLGLYNASEPQYIGGLTEDLRQLQNYGYMAYGGGGIFLSMPLLSQINEHFDECNSAGHEGGDRRVAECIYAHTTTKLSWESGLRQTDLHGDVSGFYEADREQPLSIHHWKSWNHVDVVGLSAVSQICGTACLLQRYRLADGWFLTNGFSIVKYSAGYSAAHGIDMEETWWDGGDYKHSLAPLRSKDEGKISFVLKGTEVERGRVRQYYVRRRQDRDTIFADGDSVVEMVWRRVP